MKLLGCSHFGAAQRLTLALQNSMWEKLANMLQLLLLLHVGSVSRFQAFFFMSLLGFYGFTRGPRDAAHCLQ